MIAGVGSVLVALCLSAFGLLFLFERHVERRVEAELGVRGLDPRLARVLLLPVAAELGYRVRRVRGTPPDHEDRARALLLAADRLLASR